LLRTIELSTVDGPARDAEIEAVAQQVRAGLDPRTGPLLGARLFRLVPDRRPRLFLTVHHLVVDGVSWRILLDDLATAYHQGVAGQPIRLGQPTTDVRAWVQRLTAHVRAGGVDADLAYWTGESDAREPPVDRAGA